MNLFEILVPTVKDEAKKKYYSTKYHRLWDEKVRKIAGGLTIVKPVVGQWIAPDKKVFVERMIPVRIACTRDQIEQIADLVAKHYNQQAVMYYEISNNVVIKDYNVQR